MTKNYANMKVFRDVLREHVHAKNELRAFEAGEWGLELQGDDARKKVKELFSEYTKTQDYVEMYALRLLLRHKGKNDKLCARIMRMLEKDCWFVGLKIGKNCM